MESFPEIRVHRTVPRTHSQNRPQDYEHQGWMGLLGHPLQFLFWQMDAESQWGDLSDARDHWGHWNRRLFPATMPASTICPEGWSGLMWGPATSRDSYEHPCCSNPGVLFISHYTWTAFTLKQCVRGLSWIWTMQSSSCPQKTGIYSKIREVSSRTQAGWKRDWLGNPEETGTRSEQYWSHLFIASKTDMRYPSKLCPNCRLIRTKLSWATKFGVVCYVAVASWNLPGQASFSLISVPGYLSDSQLRSYGEKSFHPVESFQTPGGSKEWPSSRESYFTLPTSASPLV